MKNKIGTFVVAVLLGTGSAFCADPVVVKKPDGTIGTTVEVISTAEEVKQVIAQLLSQIEGLRARQQQDQKEIDQKLQLAAAYQAALN